MHRREILRAAAAAAALSLLPREAEAAWRRATASHDMATAAPPAAAGPFSEAQRTTVLTVANAIIPRTDTPGANDVNVIGWIEVVTSDYYAAAERTLFLEQLDAIDALARQLTGTPMGRLASADLARVMDALDQPADRSSPAARGYLRLKGLVVHAYFTSERVQKDVLRTQIMPGRYDGAANMPTRGGGRDE
jgi:hypothetical protein